MRQHGSAGNVRKSNINKTTKVGVKNDKGRQNDFSGGPVVRMHLPATGDLGLILVGEANIPRTAGQLSLFDATKEACMLQ